MTLVPKLNTSTKSIHTMNNLNQSTTTPSHPFTKELIKLEGLLNDVNNEIALNLNSDSYSARRSIILKKYRSSVISSIDEINYSNRLEF